MDFSQFAGRLREKLTRFSGELCHRLGKTATRFVVEAVYGIIVFPIGDAHGDGPLLRGGCLFEKDQRALLPAPLNRRRLTKVDGLLHLWLAADENRTPVRLEQKTGFGTMVLRLVEVR